MLRLAAIFYGAMAVVAIALNAIRGVALVPLDMGPRLAPALGASALMTAAILLFCWFGARRWDWARELEASFRKILGPLETRDVLFLAFASGASEELFFRGALQPAMIRLAGSEAFGLFIASAAFAALHAPLDRGLRAWPVFALAIGLFLGAVTLACGNVLPAILCHVTVNAVNLKRIARPLVR
jgi:uncharacterized protein